MSARPYEENRIKSEVTWIVECSMCSLLMYVEIRKKPEKDYEQVTLDFNKIPLTDKKAVLAKRRRKI